jgi:CRP-like cAMP-binding protein
MKSELLEGVPATEAQVAAEILAACPVFGLPAGSSRPFSSEPEVVLLLVEHGVVLIRSAESPQRRRIVTAEAAAGALLVPPADGELLFALTDSRIAAILDEQRDQLVVLPGIARALVEGLDAAVRQTRENSRTFAGIRQVDRVREKLMQLGRRHGRVVRGGVRLDLPITHELLGEMLGSARETVTRALDQLQREGFIVRDGRFYRLLISPHELTV